MRVILGAALLLVIAGASLLMMPEPEPEPVRREVPVVVAAEPEPERTPALEPKPEQQTRTPALVERLDARSVRVADRFTIRGTGTQHDPYRIDWALLGSARETIDAAQGKLLAPEHIALLDGAWVAISGYYSPTVIADEVDELIISLDQWDGCCIGLPPTPFDCLRAELRNPLEMRTQHLFRYGTITGQLSVSPFVIGSWLMGLYELKDATLEATR
jgi:hypothetical protein